MTCKAALRSVFWSFNMENLSLNLQRCGARCLSHSKAYMKVVKILEFEWQGTAIGQCLKLTEVFLELDNSLN